MKFLKWCNILSIDVALGSLAIGAMIAKSLHVQMPQAWWYLLPSAVWWIYTADHLSDARKAGNNFLSERHLFHHIHFQRLLSVLILVGMAGIVLALFCLGRTLLISGFILCVISSVYLLYSFLWTKYILSKEIVVAIVYTTGVVYGPVILKNFELNTGQVALVVAVFFTAWYNLLVFSIIGEEEDKKSGFNSIVNAIGIKKTVRLSNLVFLFNCIVMLFTVLCAIEMLRFIIIIVIMNVVLLFININRKKYMIDNRYRLIGDMVFMLPALPVIID